MNGLKNSTINKWHFYRKINKGLLFRVLFCWLLGSILLVNDMGRRNYDYRFSVRGPQDFDQEIVILQISQSEWDMLLQPSFLKSIIYRGVPVTDSYYWNNIFWLKFIEALKKLEPQAVGVSFFFGSNISTNWKLERYFTESSIVWSAETDSMGRTITPRFSDAFNDNVGLNLLQPDNDGVVRRYSPSPLNIPQFAEAVAKKSGIERSLDKDTYAINFRGASGTFQTYSIADVVNNNIPAKYLKNKIFLIGPEEGKEHIIKTPLGAMSRLELYANIIDNIKHDRWIKLQSITFYSLMILLLTIISAVIILNFPQAISTLLLVSFCFLYLTISFFLFDSLYIWLPVFSALSTMLLAYVVFLSQLLFDKEQNMWRLQKEQENLSSMEQLKTNFVSLISHDLKTPLAKIQSFTHRALGGIKNTPENQELMNELQSIYKESKNLDRYIKSILQLSKIESKDFLVKKEPLDVNELIESACEQLQSSAHQKNVSLVLDLEPLFSIEADHMLLREIILNIIENAIKYTHNGTTIKIRSFEDETSDHIVVEVQDEGPGIKKEYLDKVYNKFFRADPNHQSQGSGLGLFLVKYFLELHNGTIQIASKSHEDEQKDLEHGTTEIDKVTQTGTTVTMKLPIGVQNG